MALVPPNDVTDMEYFRGDLEISMTFSEYTTNGYLGAIGTITYTAYIGATPLPLHGLSIDSATKTVTLETNLEADLGTHTVILHADEPVESALHHTETF